MLIPRVVIKKTAFDNLLCHINQTNLEYETGGILLGYKFLFIFYVVAFVFPRSCQTATKTSVVLNGKEQAEDMQNLADSFFFPPELIGIWHSHTMGDDFLSLQDVDSQKILVSQVGAIVSVVVTRRRGNIDIHLTPYYISKNNRAVICKVSKTF